MNQRAPVTWPTMARARQPSAMLAKYANARRYAKPASWASARRPSPTTRSPPTPARRATVLASSRRMAEPRDRLGVDPRGERVERGRLAQAERVDVGGDRPPLLVGQV